MRRFTIYLTLSLMPVLAFAAGPIPPDGRELTLQECITMASDNNVDVRNSHLDYLSARMMKREVQANFYPTLSAAAMGFKAINPLVKIGVDDIFGSSDAANTFKYYFKTAAAAVGFDPTYSTLSNAYSAGLVLTQPVFAGGRIVNGTRLAKLGIEAASLKEQITGREVASDVESKYWRTVSLGEKMKVVDEGLVLCDSLLKDAQAALDAGLMEDSVRDLVLSNRHELYAMKIRLKGGIILSKMDLCESIGLDISEASSLRLSDSLPEFCEPQTYWKEPSEIVASMDESRLLDMSVRQKELEKNIAMGDALPEIGVGATYGYGQVIGSPTANGIVFASAKIPLTDWAKVSDKMQRIDYQKQKAENDRDHYVAMLELKVYKMWIEVEACWDELSLKNENEYYAGKAAQRAKADYEAGLMTAGDMMAKQVALSKAGCERVDAGIAYQNAVTAYQSLTSGR